MHLQVSRIPIQSLDGIPDELKETVKAMLCIEPAVRPQAHDLAKVREIGACTHACAVSCIVLVCPLGCVTEEC